MAVLPLEAQCESALEKFLPHSWYICFTGVAIACSLTILAVVLDHLSVSRLLMQSAHEDEKSPIDGSAWYDVGENGRIERDREEEKSDTDTPPRCRASTSSLSPRLSPLPPAGAIPRGLNAKNTKLGRHWTIEAIHHKSRPADEQEEELELRFAKKSQRLHHGLKRLKSFTEDLGTANFHFRPN